MATDPQAANTLSLLNEFKFDALLLSAGGNDLKNAFKELFIEKIVLTRKKMVVPKDLASITAHPAKAGSIIDEVVGYIVSWISLRQKSKLNKETPVVLHGYDYLQPRPAPARAWVNGSMGFRFRVLGSIQHCSRQVRPICKCATSRKK
jgi:hypothetical protein